MTELEDDAGGEESRMTWSEIQRLVMESIEAALKASGGTGHRTADDGASTSTETTGGSSDGSGE